MRKFIAVRLAPGEKHFLRVERLVAGARHQLEYVYLTESGDYTLILNVRALVNRQPRVLTSETICLHVQME
jgi:hypothetical protein